MRAPRKRIFSAIDQSMTYQILHRKFPKPHRLSSIAIEFSWSRKQTIGSLLVRLMNIYITKFSVIDR